MGAAGSCRVLAAFRGGERARIARDDLRAMGLQGVEVRLVGPEDFFEDPEGMSALLPDEVAPAGGDWLWAGIEKQWLNHVLLIAEGVPLAAAREVTRALRQDGAEHVEVDESP